MINIRNNCHRYYLTFKSIKKQKLLLIFIFSLVFILSKPLIMPGVTNSSLSFGNLRLNIEANKSSPEITKAVLEFIPLSSEKKFEKKSEFYVKIGNDESTITKVTSIPKSLTDNKVIEINHGKNFTKIKTSTISIPLLKLLMALSQEDLQVTGLILPDSYYNAIEYAQNIILEHEITKISEIKTRNSEGWLHLYPLDKTLLKISFDPKQMVMTSDIEIKTPSNFDSDMTLSGIDVKFKKDGDTYNLDKKKERDIIIPAGTPINIEGELKRYWTERDILTIGQVIIAIILGIISGIIISVSSGTSFNLDSIKLFPLGGGGLGIIYVLHKNILSRHPDIPSIIYGGTFTIFELFTIGSIVVFIPITYLASKQKWSELIVISIVILVVAVIARVDLS